MESFAGKIAVVTGGGSGIGRGIALALAHEGANVAVADLRAPAAEAVTAEIIEAGGAAFPVEVDVTSEASLSSARDDIAARGGVHVLCANAGVLARIAPLDQHSIADWEYTFSVNVLGVVKTVNAFLPALRERSADAHIVNTASLGGLISTEGFPIGAYIASKYACVGYSEMLRAELAGEGIGVSVLCPGVVASDLVTTSNANRPGDFGAAGAPVMGRPAQDADATTAQVNVMAAEDVGRVVVAAIRANRLHVITHPQSRPVVEGRFAAILDDYDFATKAQG